MVSILGAGLLVGTALAVIIPEGVHALYESDQHGEKSVSFVRIITQYFSPFNSQIKYVILLTVNCTILMSVLRI